MTQEIYFHFAISLLITYIIARLILTSILRLITEAGYVRPNFRGDQIPVGVGLLFFLSALIPTGVLIFLDEDTYQLGGLLYLFVLGSMTLLGMTDDIFGSRADSGLKGHLKKMLRGELTTGGLKLVTGGIMSLVVAVNISNHWLEVITNTLVIALSVNAINLLDLRPGRAGKGYLLAVGMLLLASWPANHLVWGVITAGALLAYLPSDLKARAMMGDTGSNALGASIGITSVLVLPENLKIGYLLFLIAFHIFTEKYSLTKVIERNKMLNFLDQLGRN
ncbi:hypothetical protein [Desulfotomaculum sp. 1211_IL3151]|uniref:hypothetical protein n=1 Tax=Desulfotomaculum sp. 1211_IL3151 TaxID=3084055 RepID=UPI002FDA5020